MLHFYTVELATRSIPCTFHKFSVSSSHSLDGKQAEKTKPCQGVKTNCLSVKCHSGAWRRPAGLGAAAAADAAAVPHPITWLPLRRPAPPPTPTRFLPRNIPLVFLAPECQKEAILGSDISILIAASLKTVCLRNGCLRSVKKCKQIYGVASFGHLLPVAAHATKSFSHS